MWLVKCHDKRRWFLFVGGSWEASKQGTDKTVSFKPCFGHFEESILLACSSKQGMDKTVWFEPWSGHFEESRLRFVTLTQKSILHIKVANILNARVPRPNKHLGESGRVEEAGARPETTTHNWWGSMIYSCLPLLWQICLASCYWPIFELSARIYRLYIALLQITYIGWD